MLKLKKHKLLLIALYILYKLCNLHIANCEGLTDVYSPDLSKVDKTIGWTVIISTTLLCGYLIYKGLHPTDSQNHFVEATSIVLKKDTTLALDDKINANMQQDDASYDITELKNCSYLNTLQNITKHYTK